MPAIFGEAEGSGEMRFLLKGLVAPVIVILSVFVWVCSALLYCSAFLFGLLSTVLGLFGLAVLILSSVRNGIILFVLAFLVGPMGLPMAAAWMLGKVQDLRYAVQDRVYG